MSSLKREKSALSPRNALPILTARAKSNFYGTPVETKNSNLALGTLENIKTTA